MGALLEVKDLEVGYRTQRGHMTAVDKVSFDVKAGETLGLVGESGCGKSSLGKAIMRLLEPQSGSIHLDGVDITHLSPTKLRPHRRRFQMVFQDPGGSLDPRQRIGKLIEDPLKFHEVGDKAERHQHVLALMEKVGLHPDVINRLPHEFSGGQRQRIAIARALALDPALIVCDEPVSALDVSLQAQILNLLSDLQRERSMAYLFISHDLSVVQHLADRVAVMYLGQIVEIAPRTELWKRPAHPYTQALIDAVPVMDPSKSRIADKHLLAGDLPNPFNPPSGCRFNTRCPHATDTCRSVAPALRTVAPGHVVSCHLHFDAGQSPITLHTNATSVREAEAA
ncbi:oligopeptide/dipeptide ABC transporter ATP-binding protein [Uliginosibacterium sp. H3]|uniref:Oligopeptide/dipeptide ABC transporter ATP-binding protein n=1 Tax=Uliginosibacterium silvisoli TaxID=3114758 RepID=A0ABU6K442_9RHOO|nr:oligopeptide/dipeptide ABC transporter ATP-binding protein [Uliginosibacterium sp. H3]